jgi:hypothetical protein
MCHNLKKNSLRNPQYWDQNLILNESCYELYVTEANALQNVERQNVERQNVERQNVERQNFENKSSKDKTSMRQNVDTSKGRL